MAAGYPIILFNHLNHKVRSRIILRSMVACFGPLATIDCGPSQARKGAASAVDSGAGVRLVQVTTFSCNYSSNSSFGPDATLFRTQSVTYVYMLPHSVRNKATSDPKSKHDEQSLKCRNIKKKQFFLDESYWVNLYTI